MPEANGNDAVRARVDLLFRSDSRRVFAALLRVLGDFDLAEEALGEAFAAALQQWPHEGVPRRPLAWLVSAGRFRAVDALRRRARFDAALAELASRIAGDDGALAAADPAAAAGAAEAEDDVVADDRLRLIFACCHPALAIEAQVALTLREACGLTTEAIARAFLVTPSALAQRIVRAKATLRELRAVAAVPPATEARARIDGVLRVLYLVFNEGYQAPPPAAATGHHANGADLGAEAVRLAQLVRELTAEPEPEPEVDGLLALMLLHDARRPARFTAAGDIVLLDEQDRSRWDRDRIAAGSALVERALRSRRFGPYTLQAAIAAVHAEAPDAAATDWPQIVGLYDLLLRVEPSPVVALNRAIAVAMRDGPAAGLALVDELLQRGGLDGHAAAHGARADLCRRLGRTADARASYVAALRATGRDRAADLRFLQRRLDDLGA